MHKNNNNKDALNVAGPRVRLLLETTLQGISPAPLNAGETTPHLQVHALSPTSALHTPQDLSLTHLCEGQCRSLSIVSHQSHRTDQDPRAVNCKGPSVPLAELGEQPEALKKHSGWQEHASVPVSSKRKPFVCPLQRDGTKSPHDRRSCPLHSWVPALGSSIDHKTRTSCTGGALGMLRRMENNHQSIFMLSNKITVGNPATKTVSQVWASCWAVCFCEWVKWKGRVRYQGYGWRTVDF